MSNQLNDIKSLFERIKKIEAFLKARKLKNILKKHSKNLKNVRNFLIVMISDVTMKQMMKKLLKCDKVDVIEAVYCMKKQFNEKMNNNSLLYKNYENKLKKKELEKSIFAKRLLD